MEAASARHCPPWADLQPELVGLVLRRLSSLADRVRVRAVCRAWRRIAGEEPSLPPPLPWLTLLDGTFLSISDGTGETHRVRVPEDASIHGSVGNWLFLRRLGGKLALMNPFSDCVVPLPMDAHGCYGDSMSFKLVLLSAHLDPSPDSLFALLTVASDWKCAISIGQRPSPPDIVFEIMPEFIFDIAFFEGTLYALSPDNLFAFEIASSDGGGDPPSISSATFMANDAAKDPGLISLSIGDKTYDIFYIYYLVESNGKLLQIRRMLGALSTLPDDAYSSEQINYVTISFEVFELELTTSSHHEWRRLNTLGDQALFVGTYSKFISAACECGAQKNCIYFVCDYDYQHWTADLFGDCGVFDMSNGMITPLLSDSDTKVVRPQGCRGLPAWFFPTKTM